MSVGNFAILAFVDPIGIVTTPSGMEVFESQGHGSLSLTLRSLDSWWIAYEMADPISKQAWRYTIGSTPNFGSFRAAKMTPFWDPNFPLPCGQLAAPFLYAHREPGPHIVHSDISPRSCLLPCEPLALPWSGEPRVRRMQIFSDFGIMTPLDEPVVP